LQQEKNENLFQKRFGIRVATVLMERVEWLDAEHVVGFDGLAPMFALSICEKDWD
jgi:hypothetical protein